MKKHIKFIIYAIILIAVLIYGILYFRTHSIKDTTDNNQITIDNENKINKVKITKEEAFALILEKSELKDKHITFSDEYITINDESYLIFNILEKNNSGQSTKIAVNEITGEIYFFNNDTITIEPIQNINSSDTSSSPTLVNYDWDGEFVNEENNSKLEVYRADSNRFEFTINYDDGNTQIQLSDIAEISGNTAIFSSDDTEIKFSLEQNNIVISVIKGDSIKVLAGKYTKK